METNGVVEVTPGRILEEVQAECASRGLTLLFLGCCGSRAMGLSLPGSDFDVRGAVLRPLREYLSLDEPRRRVEAWSVERDSLDMVLWDLRKMLSLLAASNRGAFEALASPSLFRHPAALRLAALAERFLDPRRCALHSVSDAEHHWKKFIEPAQDGTLDLKKYVFLARGV